jgi:tetratricopeptide (TPR) repeat protein
VPVGDPVAVDLMAKAGDLGQGATERQQSIEMLERATALSPDLAPAWSALASRYYTARSEIGRGCEFTEKAKTAAERALALDRAELGSAVAIGRVLVEAGKAEEVARRAVAVIAERPDAFAARFALGYACRFGGLLDRALREFRNAGQTQSQLVAHEVATVYLQKQLYTDALRLLDEASRGGWRPSSLFVSAVAWTHIGDVTGVRDAVGELSKAAPSSVYTLMAQVLVGRLEGRNVAPLLGWLRDLETTNAETHCWLAQVHAYAGDVAAAVARLRSAVAGGYFNHPYFAADPLLGSVRSAGEATSILETARLRHEQFAHEFGAWTTQG